MGPEKSRSPGRCARRGGQGEIAVRGRREQVSGMFPFDRFGSQPGGVRATYTAMCRSDHIILYEQDSVYTGTSIAADGAAVVADCLRRFGRHRIIYRNVAGIWRELRHDGENFREAVDLAADELESLLERCGLEL